MVTTVAAAQIPIPVPIPGPGAGAPPEPAPPQVLPVGALTVPVKHGSTYFPAGDQKSCDIQTGLQEVAGHSSGAYCNVCE